MSKQRLSGIGEKSGSSIHSRMNASKELIEAKNKMWAEMIQRKEEAKKAEETVKPEEETKSKVTLMDKWYKGNSHQNAKAITALYLNVANKKVHWPSVKENYDVGLSTCQRYQAWYSNGTFSGNSNRVNKYVVKNKHKLVEAMKQSPSPTIIEIKRLYELAFPNKYDSYRGTVRDRVYKPKIEDTEMYDHMLNNEQKVELMDLANLELSEIKPVTKSDVVVGVIAGALVGGAMVAYAFLTNGAI